MDLPLVAIDKDDRRDTSRSVCDLLPLKPFHGLFPGSDREAVHADSGNPSFAKLCSQSSFSSSDRENGHKVDDAGPTSDCLSSGCFCNTRICRLASTSGRIISFKSLAHTAVCFLF